MLAVMSTAEDTSLGAHHEWEPVGGTLYSSSTQSSPFKSFPATWNRVMYLEGHPGGTVIESLP